MSRRSGEDYEIVLKGGRDVTTDTVRGSGKLLGDVKYVCDTCFELLDRERQGPGRLDVSVFLSEFDRDLLLGFAGEVFVLRLSDGAEQETLLLEDVLEEPCWRFRPVFPVNPKFVPRY